MRHAQEIIPHECAVLARQLLGYRNALLERLLEERSKRGILHLLLRSVLERLPVERGDVLADLLVETAAGLVAEPVACRECRHPVRHAEILTRAGAQSLRHVEQHVEPGDVRCAEGGALRAPEQRASERVHLVDGEVGLHHPLHRGDHAVHAQAIGDKPRDVLRDDDALAEHHLAETARGVERVRCGVGRGNEFQQVQVPRRIEEVHPEEVPLELGAPAFNEHVHRDTRGVRRDDGGRLAERLEPGIERLLWCRQLDDGLDDEVAICEEREIILEVAERDERGARHVHERGRSRLLRALEAGFRWKVALAVLGGDVKQDDWNSCRRGEGGDAAPHRSGADDAELRDTHVGSVSGAGGTDA